MPQPSIAVIMPVRNGGSYLAEAIQSVLTQEYPEIELMVVDDGSTDGSGDVARALGCSRVLETPGIGPAGARNAGIQASQSELLLLLDADDLAGPYTLQTMVDALLRTPDAGFVQGFIQNFTAKPDGTRDIFTRPYRFINLGSCLWRRSVFETVGRFDESLRLGEDHDLFMRCWERDIPRVLVDSVTLYYRRHAGNMTRGVDKSTGFGLIPVYRKRIECIRRGEYDASVPRRTSWPEYLGESPGLTDLD